MMENRETSCSQDEYKDKNGTNEKVIKIAEKVKFWEEQDQINQAIIPRVIQNHEQISKVSKKTMQLTETLGEMMIKNKGIEAAYDETKIQLHHMEQLFKEHKEAFETFDEIVENYEILENRVREEKQKVSRLEEAVMLLQESTKATEKKFEEKVNRLEKRNEQFQEAIEVGNEKNEALSIRLQKLTALCYVLAGVIGLVSLIGLFI